MRTGTFLVCTALVASVLAGLVAATTNPATTDPASPDPPTTDPVTTVAPDTTSPPVVNCSVSEWVEATVCSVTCGNGTQLFSRDVVVFPENNGTACPPLSEERACNPGPCPIDCEVGEWVEVGACTATCGGGVQARERDIVVSPMYGGAACPALNDTIACNEDLCPRPAVKAVGRDLLFTVPYGHDFRFERAPGLWSDAQPGKILSLYDLEEKDDARDARASLNAALRSAVSSVESDAAAALESTAEALRSEADSARDSMMAAVTEYTDTTVQGLSDAVEGADASIVTRFSAAVETLSDDTNDAINTLGQQSHQFTLDQSASALTAAKEYAKSYTDSSASDLRADATAKASSAQSGAVGQAKAYTDGQVSGVNTRVTNLEATLQASITSTAAGTLASAKSYTDNGVASAKGYAKSYSDSGVAGAKAYADSVSANALNSARSYSDAGVAGAKAYAVSYTDSKVANILSVSSACKSLIPHCSTCGSATSCNSCDSGYMRVNGRCYPPYTSCKEGVMLGAIPRANNWYSIFRKDNPSATVSAYCHFVRGEIHTSIPCTHLTGGGCNRVYRFQHWDHCRIYGYTMAAYRNKEHFRSLCNVYGYNGNWLYLSGGVFKAGGGGSYTGYAMRHGGVPSWTVADNGVWWLRDGTFSEPNGDYDDQCYLSQYDWNPDNVRFNDGSCSYSADRYVCATMDY
eukprot:m.276172 g.276172  ORF g.276172 m.276172 type:complete len:691 (+) comp15708_c0_seq1:84-2156(+)